jgi:CheY-like chemotaxis protein
MYLPTLLPPDALSTDSIGLHCGHRLRKMATIQPGDIRAVGVDQQRRRILVAEDDNLLAATVDDLLSSHGFCVVVAGDGQEALESAAKKRFDVLLTDLRMPRLDGASLIRRLRDDRPELPIVVMTGHAPNDWQTELQHEGEGPLVLLNKPISMRTLMRTLNDVLGEPQPA